MELNQTEFEAVQVVETMPESQEDRLQRLKLVNRARVMAQAVKDSQNETPEA